MKKLFLIFVCLYPVNTFAYYTENIPNKCGTIFNNINAIFAINNYTCNPGYFLPADTETCKICPDGYTCPGGTFTFNEKEYQGAIKSNAYITQDLTNICAKNAVQYLIAVYEINNYDCNPGYYLPANVDACTKCLNDHYCPGGTYTFNETETQGITACPSNHPFAPAGMWQQSQCGRKLHVGNDVLYLHQTPAHPTQHRLYIGYINGTNYSANAVPRDMNAQIFPKISAGASKGLHVMIDNVEYLICDDSVCPNTE